MTGLEDVEAKDGELVKLVYTVAKIWILDDYGLDMLEPMDLESNYRYCSKHW